MEEPTHVAESIALMKLSHAVITSVDRDDLPDLGAAHWACTIREIKRLNPETTIEVLIPDFQGAVRHINTIKKKNQLIAGKLDSLMSYEEELEKLHRQIDESKISVAEEQEREDSINKDLFRKMVSKKREKKELEKMKSSKITALILCFCLMLSMTACGSNNKYHLNPETVAKAVKAVKPDGVDVSSGVENSNGNGKDFEKVKKFIISARSEN